MALLQHRRDISSTPAIFDRWKSPGDRPLPSPPSSPKGVSFPNAKVCEVLDKIWASRRLSLPQRCDYADHVTVREQDTLPPHELLVATASGEMPIRDRSSFSKEAEALNSDTIEVSQTSLPISARVFPLWQLRFFIREVAGGFFHTYPPLGGPFRSLQEAENAFARHLDESRSPMMCTDGLSRSEIAIRNELYWPDGTRKKSSKSCPQRRSIVLLVQSLLDKYNDDHSLGDHAYELEDVVSYGEIYDRESCHNVFYHINLTAKLKIDDGSHSGDGNLFFAEVTCLEREIEEYVLNCFCMITPDDKGRCYGCENNGSIDLKHPTDAQYKRGCHSSPYLGCRGFDLPWDMLGDLCEYDDEEDMLAAEESSIRHMYKCLDEEFVAKLDGASVADSGTADSSKREDDHGKGLIANLDNASGAALADSKREYDQRYAIPARRLKVEPVELCRAIRVALSDSKRGDGQGEGLRNDARVNGKRWKAWVSLRRDMLERRRVLQLNMIMT